MASGSARHTSLGWLIVTALLMGCGGDKPPPKSGDNWLDNLEKRNLEGPPPDIEIDEEEEEEAEPKEPPKPAPEVKPSSGRPMIQMGPKAIIESTFGATPGAVLKLAGEGGNFTLRIPEYALSRGYNITWKIDKKGQVKKGSVVGSIAYLKLTPGDKLEARADTAADKPFQIHVPLNGRASLNLAVGSVKTDDQGNETGKPIWKVYPPTRIEEGFGEAHFELPEIGPVMYIHATTADTTEALPEG